MPPAENRSTREEQKWTASMHKWANSILIGIAGFLSLSKLNGIEEKLNMIPLLDKERATLSLRVDFMGESISDLKTDFKEHVQAAAKHEEYIEFPKQKNKR
jgi:hypothetical protein